MSAVPYATTLSFTGLPVLPQKQILRLLILIFYDVVTSGRLLIPLVSITLFYELAGLSPVGNIIAFGPLMIYSDINKTKWLSENL